MRPLRQPPAEAPGPRVTKFEVVTVAQCGWTSERLKEELKLACQRFHDEKRVPLASLQNALRLLWSLSSGRAQDRLAGRFQSYYLS